MKKFVLLLCIFCFLFHYEMYCQQQPCWQYQFNYDFAGNRVLRQYIDPCTPQRKGAPEKYTQTAGNYNINVFPNPTRGQLAVAVENLEKDDKATVAVYDTKGTLLDKKTYSNQTTTLDITHQPAGQYMLRVETKKGIKEWVVTKVE